MLGRIRRLYQTVLRTFTWGVGGWSLTREVAAHIGSVGLTLLRRICKRSRAPDESWVEFMARTSRLCRHMIVRAGQKNLMSTVAGLLHGWTGHAARLPPTSPLHRVLQCKSLAQWRIDQLLMPCPEPANATRWRHSNRGRPVGWERSLEQLDTGDWQALAQQRDSWRILRVPLIIKIHRVLRCRNWSPQGPHFLQQAGIIPVNPLSAQPWIASRSFAAGSSLSAACSSEPLGLMVQEVGPSAGAKVRPLLDITNKLCLLLLRVGLIHGKSSFIDRASTTFNARARSLATAAANNSTTTTTWTYLDDLQLPLQVLLHFESCTTQPANLTGAECHIDVMGSHGNFYVHCVPKLYFRGF